MSDHKIAVTLVAIVVSLALFHSALSLACGAALAAVLGAGAARSTHGKGSPSAP